MNKIWKKLLSFILSVFLFILPINVFSVEVENFQDYERGQQDAKAKAENYGAGGFFWLGCLLSWVGFIISFIAEPEVPQEELIGKSEAYILGYTTTYKEIAKSKNINRALIGSSINTGIVIIGGVVIFVILINEAKGCTQSIAQNIVQQACSSMLQKACSSLLLSRILIIF